MANSSDWLIGLLSKDHISNYNILNCEVFACTALIDDGFGKTPGIYERVESSDASSVNFQI